MQAPSTVAPYAPGSLHDGFVADGLKALNFGRYLAGLPADVTVNPALQVEAQYGAVLLAASDFSHYPAKPADMPQDFYDRGRAVTSSSNLALGYSSVAESIYGYLDDSDSDNITALGHRRWLLNPALKETAFGYAASRTATLVFDWSRAEDVDYDIIAYPSAGAFPADLLEWGPWFGVGDVAWHITLNPAIYDWDSTGQSVTMKRVADGRIWTFNQEDTTPLGDYFSANFTGYGVGNAFIFRPAPDSIEYRSGDSFDITLSGGIFEEGTRTPITVRYRTDLMALQPFVDMPFETQFFEEVAWMADKQISKGYPDGTYRPVSQVSREAMAAFIYRAAGSPAFTPPNTPSFTDVPTGSQFYKEIEWMRAKGLARGWEVATTFEYRPHQPINRDAMAAFLYRLAMSPPHSPSGQTFVDVPTGTQFYVEMDWLASMGITTGWATNNDKEFRPMHPVNRDAMAAFLFRYVQVIGTPAPY